MKVIVKDQVTVLKVEIESATDIRMTLKVTVFVDENSKYTCDVERQDTFRLKPSFEDNQSDDDIYVCDLFFKTDQEVFDSVDDLKTAFLAEIEHKFTDLNS